MTRLLIEFLFNSFLIFTLKDYKVVKLELFII